MNSKRVMAQLLKHLAATGVTHLPKVEIAKPSRLLAKTKGTTASAPAPVATSKTVSAKLPSAEAQTVHPAQRLAAATSTAEIRRLAGGMISSEDLRTNPDRPVQLSEVHGILRQQFTDSQQKNDALCILAKAVAGCQRCSDLASKRTQTVFGVGNPNAKIMLIGEAPGAEEDAKGEPFVGPAGQLLNKIIEASQLKRDELYICNILRCRPPGNRNPLPQEASNCREFLDAQIHIVKPEYIICLGTVAAQNLLNRKEPVGKLREQLFDYRGIKVMCTYHPSYLLRNPAAKKQVWDDMKFFMKHLGVELQ